MVTYNLDSKAKMSRPQISGSSVSSGFRLLDTDQCDTVSSVSRNSIYKLKIDAMFDDSRSIISQRYDYRLNNERSTLSRIDKKSSNLGNSSSYRQNNDLENVIEDDVNRISNTVQAQIERMFTDVIKDTTSCSFHVRCLGSLPIKDKVTSLFGLQDPLRQLYLTGAGHGNQNAGKLDICSTGLKIRLSNGLETQMTPFRNIAVWSAVKFIVSPTEGGAAFLPLITDPENIDKSSLFSPLSAADRRRLSSSLHAPIFAVVMRSLSVTKQLECQAFVCQTAEDAIIIAATLYQSLMAHMGNSKNQKIRVPRNQNGVSCISIASSSVGNNVFGSTNNQFLENNRHKPSQMPPRPPRKKRSSQRYLSENSHIINLSIDERKKRSHKISKAPPIPGAQHNENILSYLENQRKTNLKGFSGDKTEQSYKTKDPSRGDIFTRVAIPRSGSFLNTSGLTRYKSKATRRALGKNENAGYGGRSPLGFSELFNEFRLQENLHSFDDILYAIVNSDGMSFNDLKPIYKEFLLKLAVTLTKDELYQKSKSIMRRQKKRKISRKKSVFLSHQKRLILGSKSLKKVFGKFKVKTNTLFKQTKNVPLNTRKNDNQSGTSSSDVSANQRNELTMNGQNRNSSSGYVSCSECSYDSETCTCTSADRCYCSLGADHDQVNIKLNKTDNRISLLSCPTEDKCYCSISECNDIESTTSWCDSDSCVSNSKCYCVHKEDIKIYKQKYQLDNLALDYELFTVGSDSGKQVKSHEALSVKKSVEMAALFADIKLSQTTDISSLAQPINTNKLSSVRSNKSSEIVLRNNNTEHSLKRNVNHDDHLNISRPVSASLEDSLGYLP